MLYKCRLARYMWPSSVHARCGMGENISRDWRGSCNHDTAFIYPGESLTRPWLSRWPLAFAVVYERELANAVMNHVHEDMCIQQVDRILE